MSSIRETSSAEHDPSEAVIVEPAVVPSILKPADTGLIAIGVGILAILLVLVTCL